MTNSSARERWSSQTFSTNNFFILWGYITCRHDCISTQSSYGLTSRCQILKLGNLWAEICSCHWWLAEGPHSGIVTGRDSTNWHCIMLVSEAQHHTPRAHNVQLCIKVHRYISHKPSTVLCSWGSNKQFLRCVLDISVLSWLCITLHTDSVNWLLEVKHMVWSLCAHTVM